MICKYIVEGTAVLAGDDVEFRTEAEAGVLQMAYAVWGRMQRRRRPWL